MFTLIAQQYIRNWKRSQETLKCAATRRSSCLSCSRALPGVYLSLHHGRSLCAQHFDSLEDVHRPFVTHPLQDDTQSDEDTCPPHASTADKREKTSHPGFTVQINRPGVALLYELWLCRYHNTDRKRPSSHHLPLTSLNARAQTTEMIHSHHHADIYLFSRFMEEEK